MQEPHFSSAPIPAPDSTPKVPVSPVAGGDWQTAPVVIRGWAYTLAFLGMVGAVLLVVFAAIGPESNPGGIAAITVLCALLFGVSFWQRKAIRRGDSRAWTVQIVLSGLSLTSFPIGTLIHGYVLSQWFKPEVKAWFGQG